MDSYERLKNIKHNLLCVIEDEMNEDIYAVDTDELGKVIDMLKDVEKAMYYCTVVAAMHSECTTPEITHHAEEWDTTKHGRSAYSRKAYLEAKAMHHDKATQLHELEKYMQELTTDIVEMISDSSPEEKQYLEKKMNTLATKIGQMK